MTKECNCNFCAIDNEDNGYKYILDELKRIRNDIDTTIHLLEKRVEKDNIIDNILATDCKDFEDDKDSNDVDIDELLTALNKIKRRPYYPNEGYTRIGPKNVTWYPPNRPWYWY